MEFLGVSGRRSFSEHYLKPLIAFGRLTMTIPDKLNDIDLPDYLEEKVCKICSFMIELDRK